ncbi:helix-turn-helix domain-containing protein [Apilactobacillus sp. M161]|uniref:Helix-turn-helix domain-containing protein n=1 Tax=Apilactobacillus xinyiensis TaxID=2841032 RepID=A0ABT0I3A3_9LACO|nr:helix-turn-helix domain-containing protein [Apilactobacillus xinyiensis]MCK8625201.1 helix-turn-helix domain-containing protein [Apilactobacillus xinyiensis]
MEDIQNKFSVWRKIQYDNKVGFFPIFSDFSKKIPKLSTGAISLYVFLGLKSNYKTGTSFYSINKLSIIFDKSPRTISIWIKNLEDNGLIYREQKRKNGVSVTYLLPYK